MNIYKLYKNNLTVLSSISNLNSVIYELEKNNIKITDITDLFNEDIMGDYRFDVEECSYSDII